MKLPGREQQQTVEPGRDAQDAFPLCGAGRVLVDHVLNQRVDIGIARSGNPGRVLRDTFKPGALVAEEIRAAGLRLGAIFRALEVEDPGIARRIDMHAAAALVAFAGQPAMAMLGAGRRA